MVRGLLRVARTSREIDSRNQVEGEQLFQINDLNISTILGSDQPLMPGNARAKSKRGSCLCSLVLNNQGSQLPH